MLKVIVYKFLKKKIFLNLSDLQEFSFSFFLITFIPLVQFFPLVLLSFQRRDLNTLDADATRLGYSTLSLRCNETSSTSDVIY
jgi:hypothetical protein